MGRESTFGSRNALKRNQTIQNAAAKERKKKSTEGSKDAIVQKLNGQSGIVDFTSAKQCFLLSLVEFLGQVSATSKNTKGFRHSICLADNDPGLLVSQLNKPTKDGNISKALNVKPDEISRFVPKISLSKVLYKDDGSFIGEARIPFSTDSSASIDSIVSSRAGRGDDVGLVDVSISFENTNAFAASRAVNGSIKILFQNGESLTKDRTLKIASSGGGTVGFRFSDLISRRGQSPRKFEGQYYRIRLDLGYQTPDDETESLSPTLIEQLTAMNVSMILELIDYDLSFEQNGALTLEISYRSFIEGTMSRATYDVFTETSSEYASQLKRLDERIDNKTKEIKSIENQVAAAEGKGSNKRSIEDAQKRLDDTKSSREETEFETEKVKIRNKVDRFAKILTYMYDNNKVRKLEIPKESLIYFSPEYFQESKRESASDFKSLAGVELLASQKTIDQYGEAVTVGKRNEQTEKLMGDVRASLDERTVKSKANEADYQREFARSANRKQQDGEQALESLKKSAGDILTNIDFQISDAKTPDLDPNKMPIYWFYYGDLITAVIETANLSEKIRQDRLGLMFGNAQVPGTENNAIATTLSDLPISLEKFQLFIKKMYIDRSITRISLFKFIQDTLNQLVMPSMNEMCFGESVASPMMIKSSMIEIGTLETADGTVPEPFPSHSDVHEKRIIARTSEGGSLEQLCRQSHLSKRNANQRYYYNFIYVDEVGLPSTLTGDPVEDAKRGVYHFYIGTDRGLLKEASFSKAKKNFQAEVMAQRAVADEDEFAEIFNLFNIEMEMIGNTLLKPGQYVFLNPTLTGIGAETSKTLGLGGYFLVLSAQNSLSADGWTTTIAADSVSRVSSKKVNLLTPIGENSNLLSNGSNVEEPI